MQTQQGAFKGPTFWQTVFFHIRRDNQTFVTSPGKSHAEEFKSIEHGFYVGGVCGLKFDAEQTTGSLKIPFPEFMTRIIG